MPRTPLWKRLPDIWHRLDRERDAQGNIRPGVAERICGVLDNGFDRAHGKATELLDLRSVDLIPDRYLSLLGELVGHEWRSDKDHAWNRRRIRDAIRRYSYKGTLECIGDLIREHGGGAWSVTDQASRLWVWNRQGRFNRDDSHLMAADFWHDGAFLLRVTDELDLDAFMTDFERVRPAGEVWVVEVVSSSPTVVSDAVSSCLYELDSLDSTIPTGRFNRDLWLTFAGDTRAEVDQQPVSATVASFGVFGCFNRDLWLTFQGDQRAASGTDSESAAMAVSGGSLTVDSIVRILRSDIAADQGTPFNPLSPESVFVQEPAEIEEEELP